jgi:hypothetical protein
LPVQRNPLGLDTLDLDLDLIVNPDHSIEWKDEADYQKAIDEEIILSEWTEEIERAKIEILDKLKKRKYPFDNSWLDWIPDSNWPPPRLPKNWDEI